MERTVKTIFRTANWKEPSLSRKRVRLELEERKLFYSSCWWQKITYVSKKQMSTREFPISLNLTWVITAGCFGQLTVALGPSLLASGTSIFECSYMCNNNINSPSEVHYTVLISHKQKCFPRRHKWSSNWAVDGKLSPASKKKRLAYHHQSRCSLQEEGLRKSTFCVFALSDCMLSRA